MIINQYILNWIELVSFLVCMNFRQEYSHTTRCVFVHWKALLERHFFLSINLFYDWVFRAYVYSCYSWKQWMTPSVKRKNKWKNSQTWLKKPRYCSVIKNIYIFLSLVSLLLDCFLNQSELTCCFINQSGANCHWCPCVFPRFAGVARLPALAAGFLQVLIGSLSLRFLGGDWLGVNTWVLIVVQSFNSC